MSAPAAPDTGPLPPRIEAASIDWETGQPCSRQFDDIYFSCDGGLDEARHVFLKHNALEERFARVPAGGQFVVAEAGFGTGRNFLATWQAWLAADPPADAILHFVSVERYPLSPDDLARAHGLWPELAELSQALRAQYPPLVTGAHRLVLAGGRVRLTLYFGDALTGWCDLEFTADAWFLDGFAPARNPRLWQREALQAVRAHSRHHTTLATYTVAAGLRSALAETGFQVERVGGFGHKREMLRAQLQAPEMAAPVSHPPARVAIVGAGIGGCLLAHNLAGRGRRVVLVDQAPAPAAGASGNAQGALYVKLGVDYNDQTRLALSALLFGQGFYGRNGGAAWHPTGLLSIAGTDAEARRQAKFLARNDYPGAILRPVSATEASALTGIAVPQGGLWFAGCGWLQPAELCRKLLDHPNIDCIFDYPVQRLLPCSGRWRLSGGQRQDLSADQVVLCAGHRTPELLPLPGGHRFRAIRGQITRLPEAALTRPPRAVVCGTRYLNPPLEGAMVTGATFDLHDLSPGISDASHQENLNELEAMIPGVLKPALATDNLDGRVAFRCTTFDYQPAAGPLRIPAGDPLDGVFLFTGLGSKGLSYAPLLAEQLADTLCGQPRALPRSLARRLAPQRCLSF